MSDYRSPRAPRIVEVHRLINLGFEMGHIKAVKDIMAKSVRAHGGGYILFHDYTITPDQQDEVTILVMSTEATCTNGLGACHTTYTQRDAFCMDFYRHLLLDQPPKYA